MILIEKMVILFIYIIILSILTTIYKRYVKKKVLNGIKNRQQQYIAVKIIRISYFMLIAGGAIIILGFDLDNIWLTLGGVLGLIAIGFVAVWSMLSNILCAFIIIITKPFELDSTIEVFPDKIKGVVVEITMFFTIIQTKKGQYIHIPNNYIFTKYIGHTPVKK